MAKKKQVCRTLSLPNGKRLYRYGDTEQEAEAKIDELKAQMAMGIKIDDNSTVADVAKLWYDLYKKPHLRYKSREAITNVVNNHIVPHIGHMPIREVKPAHIQFIMSTLQDKSQTLNRQVYQALNGIFDCAIDNELVLKSPITSFIKPAGKATEEKMALTSEETNVLLEAVRDTRAYLLVLTLLQTGLRRGEAIGLMWTDIDLKTGFLNVNRNGVFHDNAVVMGDLKTKAANRKLPIPADLLRELKHAKRESKSLYVFAGQSGDPLTRSGFRKLWELINTRSAPTTELGTAKKHSTVIRTIDFDVTPHQLRHTYITRLFEAGLDIKEIQYLAGHSSPTLTLRIYTHYDQKTREQTTAELVKKAFS